MNPSRIGDTQLDPPTRRRAASAWRSGAERLHLSSGISLLAARACALLRSPAFLLAAVLMLPGCGDRDVSTKDVLIDETTVNVNAVDALLDMPFANLLLPRSVCPDIRSLADSLWCAVDGQSWLGERYLGYTIRTPWREMVREISDTVRVGEYGYLPLPLFDTVTVETGYKVYSDKVLELDLVLDGTTYSVERGSFLDPEYAATYVTGPYTLTFGPPNVTPENKRAEQGEGELKSILPVRLDIDTSKLPVEMHKLEMWAGGGRREPALFPLYFAPYLDAGSILRESDSVLWIGTNTQGLLRIDLGGNLRSAQDDEVKRVLVLREQEDDSELLENRTTASLRDSLGRIWIGQGYVSLKWVGPIVSVLDKNGTVLRTWDYTQKVGSAVAGRDLSAFSSMPMVEVGGSKVVFPAGKTGLMAVGLDLEGDPVPVEGLIDNNVSGLAVDGNGYLWASTYDTEASLDRGVDGVSVFRLDPVDGEIRWVTHFTMDEGIRTDQLFQVWADANNRIWIGSNLGTYILDYGEEPEDKADDTLVLNPAFKMTQPPIGITKDDALIHGSPLRLLKSQGTPLDPLDDVYLNYDGIGFGTSGGTQLAPSLFAMVPQLLPLPSPDHLLEWSISRLVEDESGGLERFDVRCPWLLFLETGPDAGSVEDDRAWTLYGGERPTCGKVFLPPGSAQSAR